MRFTMLPSLLRIYHSDQYPHLILTQFHKDSFAAYMT
jgi:hypothetical protein